MKFILMKIYQAQDQLSNEKPKAKSKFQNLTIKVKF